MTDYRPFGEVLTDSLKDPETRAEWERTQLARDVSIWLLRYRRDNDLTQTELAKILSWKQPVIARLESGEHEPSIGTLRKLVERLDTRATIDIRPDSVEVHFGRSARGRTNGHAAPHRRSKRSAITTAPSLPVSGQPG